MALASRNQPDFGPALRMDSLVRVRAWSIPFELTGGSPDLVYRSYDARGDTTSSHRSDIVDVLFPAEHPAPIVTVQAASILASDAWGGYARPEATSRGLVFRPRNTTHRIPAGGTRKVGWVRLSDPSAPVVLTP